MLNTKLYRKIKCNYVVGHCFLKWGLTGGAKGPHKAGVDIIKKAKLNLINVLNHYHKIGSVFKALL